MLYLDQRTATAAVEILGYGGSVVDLNVHIHSQTGITYSAP